MHLNKSKYNIQAINDRSIKKTGLKVRGNNLTPPNVRFPARFSIRVKLLFMVLPLNLSPLKILETSTLILIYTVLIL